MLSSFYSFLRTAGVLLSYPDGTSGTGATGVDGASGFALLGSIGIGWFVMPLLTVSTPEWGLIFMSLSALYSLESWPECGLIISVGGEVGPGAGIASTG